MWLARNVTSRKMGGILSTSTVAFWNPAAAMTAAGTTGVRLPGGELGGSVDLGDRLACRSLKSGRAARRWSASAWACWIAGADS